MSDQGRQESAGRKVPRSSGPRLHHVAAHIDADRGPAAFDEIVVFGTELDALRHIVGKDGWVYKPLANGQQFGEVNGL